MSILKKLKDKHIIDKKAEQVFYQMAIEEIRKGEKRPALWAMALAKSEGDLNKAESIYITLLVQEYKDDLYLAKRLDEEENKQRVQEVEQQKKYVVKRHELRTTESESKKIPVFWWVLVGVIAIGLFILIVTSDEKSPPVKSAESSSIPNSVEKSEEVVVPSYPAEEIDMHPIFVGSLPVYGGSKISSLNSIEFGQLVVELMPDSSNTSNLYEWSHLSNDKKIRWLDETYSIEGNQSSRKGVVRVNVQNHITTYFSGKEYELPWAIIYQTNNLPKFGVDSISIFPALPDSASRESSNCFEFGHKNCEFGVLPSLKQAGIEVQEVCRGSFSTYGYRLMAVGKKEVFAIHSISRGSGGASAYFEIYPNLSKDEFCALVN